MTCSDSEFTSETLNPFKHFRRTPWEGDRSSERPSSTQDSTTQKNVDIRGCIQKFPDWVDNEINKINTRWEATQRIMVPKLTRLIHKIAIQLHLVAERCTTCSSRSRQPVRKLLDTPSYIHASSGIRNHDPNTFVHYRYNSRGAKTVTMQISHCPDQKLPPPPYFVTFWTQKNVWNTSWRS
jgi:hypothetical protein